MNLKQELFGVLSLLALTQLIKADYLKSTFELASPNISHICSSQYDGTILPHTIDCHKFFVCINSKPQLYNCDDNFHFDEKTRTCVAGTECGSEKQPPSSCVDGSINAVENDCYIFEICVKGEYQKLNCPANYYFHGPQGICVPVKFDAQYKCGCVLPEHTVVANVNNCETYFICQNKTSVMEYCPLGQYYNSSVNACIYDLEGICLIEPTKTANLLEAEQQIQHATMSTTDAKILCARLSLKNIQFHMFAHGCNELDICVNGILYRQQCPPGFYYDNNKTYCVVDSENKCKVFEEQHDEFPLAEKELTETIKLFQTQENIDESGETVASGYEELSYKPKPERIQQHRFFSKFIDF